jgi:hypothetical protein
MAPHGPCEERAVIELLFRVEGNAEGGYTALAVGESIVTAEFLSADRRNR